MQTYHVTQQNSNNKYVNNNDDDDDNNNNNTLIDVAIPGDRNVTKKEAEKILKYKDLTIEIQRMCNVKTKVTPVIIGATGTISKSIRKYLISVPEKHDIRIAATLYTLETWFVSGI
jgi:hypothetical protein